MIKPPIIARWLLFCLSGKEERRSILDDFSEIYEELAAEQGRRKAARWYRFQVMQSIPVFCKNLFYWKMIMFKNYLKAAVRNITRQKVYSVINVLGLAVGLTCCILIYLYAADELSYDNFHKNNKSLYRVLKIVYDNSDGSTRDRGAALAPAMGAALPEYFPEIKYQTRFWTGTGVVRRGDKMFRDTVSMADSTFFRMFTFPLLSGSPETVLSRDNAIVLTESYAKKYFGEQNPLGKTLTIAYGETKKDYIVSGTAKDVPSNSSIQFDMLINIANLPAVTGHANALSIWDRLWFPVYVQLKENASLERIEQRFQTFTTQYFSSSIRDKRDQGEWTRKENPFSFQLQPMKDVYLDNAIGLSGRGLTPSLILIGIALIVLVIASINFMNLSMGMSSVRSREIGIRKVIGAEKRQLIGQFLSESVLMAAIAMGAAVIFASQLLPAFNRMADKQLSMGTLININNTLPLAGFTLLTGILAGSCPAIVMSGFKPIEILRGKLKIGGKTFLTKSLVVIQFALSVFLIISAILLGAQVKYLVQRDMGYDKEGLVAVLTQEYLSGKGMDSERVVNLFRSKVMSHQDVLNVTATSNWFGIFGAPQYKLEIDGQKMRYHWNRVDNNFARTLGLEIIRGRDFSENIAADADAAIVNETFVRTAGWENPLGKIISASIRDYSINLRVVGVVNDYHYGPLDDKILPTVLLLKPVRAYNRMLVRISAFNIKETITFLENTWKEIQPEKPFTYYFQDELLKNLYNTEKRWSAIVQYSSILAVLVACMGIFGLTALTISRRVKEIGIRKVFGAKVSQIVNLVIKEFVFLVALANLLAWPVVYLVIKKVLQNYPYRVSIGIHYFFIAGTASLIIAVLTILYLAVKAANANPVEAIRNE